MVEYAIVMLLFAAHMWICLQRAPVTQRKGEIMPQDTEKAYPLPVGFYGPRRAFVAVLDPIQKRIFDPWGEHVITTWLDNEGEECEPHDAVACVAHIPAGRIVDENGDETVVMRWMSLQIKPLHGDQLH